VSKPVKPRITRDRVSANGKTSTTRRKYVRPGSAEDGDKRLLALQRDLIGMANDGYFDDYPDVKARVLADYNPLVELAIAGLIAPGDSQRIIANKIVSEFCFVPLKTEGAAVDNSRQPINITIANWAAAAQPKAIEHQPVPVDYVDGDKTIRAFRQSPPSQAPTEPAYVELEMRPDGGGVERPAPIEQPQTDARKPKRYAFNERTGHFDVVNEDRRDSG
jgi:hypothetical protein